VAKHRDQKSKSSSKKKEKATPVKTEVLPPPPAGQNTAPSTAPVDTRTPRERMLAGLRPPWKPGQSGNPGGRPKKVLDPILRAFMERKVPKDKHGRTYAQKFIEEIVARALTKSDVLAREVFARLDGMLTPETEMEAAAQAGVKVIILDAPRPQRPAPVIPALPANQSPKGEEL
jgi:hypothetical protein